MQQFAEGFTSPMILTPLDKNRLLVADQVGTVHVVGRDGKVADGLFLDLKSKLVELKNGFDERGLLSLALHPKFSENGKVYVVYNAPLRRGGPPEWDSTLQLSEFKVPQGASQADASSERILLQIDKPYFNHNGGRIAFGPDGMLYMSAGDGGNAHDVGRGHGPMGNGQDRNTLLGKILRIDVNQPAGTKQYSIPQDNPFASGGGRPEIFAYGVRNSWGISFDRGGKHELFAADVGQSRFEEINIIVKGGNYGWNVREGYACFDPKDAMHPPEDCPKVDADGKPFIDPIVAYKNVTGFKADGLGASVTGGYVYRGKALPQLDGQYIFADWSASMAKAQGSLFVAKRPTDGGARWSMDRLALKEYPEGRIPAYIVAMGQDDEGEVYVLTNGRNGVVGKDGKIFKLVAR